MVIQGTDLTHIEMPFFLYKTSYIKVLQIIIKSQFETHIEMPIV